MFGFLKKRERPYWSPISDPPPEYTLEEKQRMRFEHRRWHSLPAGDLSDPNEVLAWAGAIIRAGEGGGSWDEMEKTWKRQRSEAAYLARCVTIAEALEKTADGSRIAWRAIRAREQRLAAKDIIERSLYLAGELQKAIAEYDAAKPNGISGSDDEG